MCSFARVYNGSGLDYHARMTAEHEEPGPQARRESRMRDDVAAVLTIVRHGEPDWDVREGKVENPRLTPRGIRQAEAVGAALAGRSHDALFASPLRRAQETAAAIGRATGLASATAAGLEEIRVRTGGLRQDEVDEYFTQALNRPLHEQWQGWPGSGETFHDFHRRVTEEIGRILGAFGIVARRNADFTVWAPPPEPRSIVVTAHGGTNAVLVTHLLDIRPVPWEWLRFESELASYSVLALRSIGSDDHVWSLQNFNEVDHLKAGGLR